MNIPAITAENLSKTFGEIKALDNVSLEVMKGEIFGLIGPDGAGKSTLFRILTTLLLPDSGKASVNGFDIAGSYRDIRRIVGYMPGRFSLYPDLSVEENLKFYAALFGGKIEDNFEMIEPIYKQLAPFGTRRASNLSGGMKQKLALCCAIIHKPEVLFLDEPTTGVDAVSRGEFWEILSKIKLTGIAILVSTPYMDEASRCDRIGLINQGRLFETGSLSDIIARNNMPLLAVKSRDNYRTLLELRKSDEVVNAFLFGEYIHAFVKNTAAAISLKTRLHDTEIKAVEPGIEDVFIKIIGNERQ